MNNNLTRYLTITLVGIAGLISTSCSQSVQPTPRVIVIVPATPSAAPLPPSPQPTSAPIPTAVTAPTLALNRISFAPGAVAASVQGTVTANGTDRWTLRAGVGQTMSVVITSAQAKMIFSISGADGNVIKSSGAGTGAWSGILPTTQDYIIGIAAENGAAASYTLQVTIPPATSVYEPTPVGKRMSFAPGTISATAAGALPKNGMDRWVVKASAGQTMLVNVVPQNGNVLLVIFGVDGTVLQTDHVEVTNFSAVLPITEDYYIDVRAWNDTAPTYALQVTILPATSVNEPTPAPKRMSFAPGAISATGTGALSKNGVDRWVIKASAGQTMMVNVVPQNGNVLLVIYGVDGTVLLSDHVEIPNFTAVLPISEDYYIDVRAWNDTAPTYALQVTIPPK
jgi:hypothetical protein